MDKRSQRGKSHKGTRCRCKGYSEEECIFQCHLETIFILSIHQSTAGNTSLKSDCFLLVVLTTWQLGRGPKGTAGFPRVPSRGFPVKKPWMRSAVPGLSFQIQEVDSSPYPLLWKDKPFFQSHSDRRGISNPGKWLCPDFMKVFKHWPVNSWS